MVVKIRVLFWVLNIVRHLVFRVPKRDPDFDNHPYEGVKGLGVSVGLGAGGPYTLPLWN